MSDVDNAVANSLTRFQNKRSQDLVPHGLLEATAVPKYCRECDFYWSKQKRRILFDDTSAPDMMRALCLTLPYYYITAWRFLIFWERGVLRRCLLQWLKSVVQSSTELEVQQTITPVPVTQILTDTTDYRHTVRGEILAFSRIGLDLTPDFSLKSRTLNLNF